MKTRLAIAALIFMVIQGVMFGIGAVLILATPLKEQAMELMPWMIAATFVLAVPVSWIMAPRLRARYWRSRELRAWREGRTAALNSDAGL